MMFLQLIDLFQPVPNGELCRQLEVVLITAETLDDIGIEGIILAFMQSTDD